MTVNELIAELQVLATQGHGELDVGLYIPYYHGSDVWDANISVSKEMDFLDNTDKIGKVVFVGIHNK